MEEALTSSYTDWKRRLAILEGADDEYYMSPKWEEQWDQLWIEYEHLERIRIEGGFQTLIWQPEVQERRKTCENWRNRKSKSVTLTDHDWPQVPLHIVLQRSLGTNTRKGASHVAIALEGWHQFVEAFEEHSQFRCSLSPPQITSWTLLMQWWSGNYQDSSLSKATIAWLEAVGSSSNPGPFMQIRHSVYNTTMFNLFNREFNPFFWDCRFREIYYPGLRTARMRGVEHATAQKYGYTVYMHIRGLPLPKEGPYISSLEKPCPWFSKEIDRQEMPYYLWDVQHKRTIVVNDLVVRPEYCCVSHTWGRWRKEPVVIPGVPWLVPKNEKFDVERLPEHLVGMQPQYQFVWIDLFCIPQDRSSKADDEINRQALIFKNAVHCIAWINDVIAWERTLKALRWLGISYLHATTDPSIHDTGEILHSMSKEATNPSELWTSCHTVSNVEAPLPANLNDKSGRRMVVAIDHETLAEPVMWFSSLWTLQEAMLCPTITCVTRDWVQLEDDSGIPIPLNTLFSILNVMEVSWRIEAPSEIHARDPIQCITKSKVVLQESQHLDWPSGPRQLLELSGMTRMNTLTENPTPVGLLLAANVRQCTGDRAPAIMSALGITGWFDFSRAASCDLVLDCYPLAFVRECAEKLGAMFYMSSRQKQKVPSWDNPSNSSQTGSMMPFTKTSGWFLGIVGETALYCHNPEDHPSVRTWNIKQDGSVSIQQAGVIASTNSEVTLGYPMEIHSMQPGVANRKNIFFHDWVKCLPEGVCVFAVSLLRDPQLQIGLLLQGNSTSVFSDKRLTKVGSFATQEIVFPPMERVNWLVV